MKSTILFIVALVVGFFTFSTSETMQPIQTNKSLPDLYLFEQFGAKELLLQQIYGTNCSNLEGSDWIIRKRSARNYWEAFIWASANGEINLPIDDEIRNEFKSKKMPAAFDVRCIPYVRDIKKYLSEGGSYKVPHGAIDLKNGPMLVFSSKQKSAKASRKVEWSLDEIKQLPKGATLYADYANGAIYWRVKQIIKSDTYKNEFLIKADLYERPYAEHSAIVHSEVSYRLLCWDCRHVSSPETLQASLISMLLLEGAYMNREEWFNVGLYSDAQVKKTTADWERLRALAEAEMLRSTPK